MVDAKNIHHMAYMAFFSITCNKQCGLGRTGSGSVVVAGRTSGTMALLGGSLFRLGSFEPRMVYYIPHMIAHISYTFSLSLSLYIYIYTYTLGSLLCKAQICVPVILQEYRVGRHIELCGTTAAVQVDTQQYLMRVDVGMVYMTFFGMGRSQRRTAVLLLHLRGGACTPGLRPLVPTAIAGYKSSRFWSQSPGPGTPYGLCARQTCRH